MTRPLDRHLDDAELDAVVLSCPADHILDSGHQSQQAPQELQRHIDSCQDCSRKVQMHRRGQSEISGLGLTGFVRPSVGCPKAAAWLQVAAGLVSQTETRELMSHAAQCDHCGPLLRSAAYHLSDEATPEEERTLTELRSGQPDWQRDLAGKLSPNVVRTTSAGERQTGWWRGLAVWPGPAFAAAVVTVLIVAGWLGSNLLRAPSVEQLLAQAYAEQRTLEVRIPGAKYAPLHVQRGGGGSSLDRPPSLLKAEALIAQTLRQHPNDPVWLEAKARADLLDGNYESAIQSLQRAMETQPDVPQLSTDLASAYFQRAEASARSIDYGNAIESLGKALAKSPNDPIALFNRAIVSERMFLYTQAVDDWEHYLRVDPTSPWADEARKRLGSLRAKLKEHEQSQSKPLLPPSRFVEILSGKNESAKAEVDQRVEDYLNLGLTQWLPAAFPIRATGMLNQDVADARRALSALADLQAQKHLDRWLLDLLETIPSLHFARAIEALSKARQADEAGDPSSARTYANLARQLFHRAGNDPGALRAQLEEVYALQRSAQGDRCLQVLTPLRAHLQGKAYAWMEGQALLEGMVCWGMVGDLQSAQHDSEAAVAATERSRYDALHLRSLAFAASLATEKGDEENSWAKNLAGIQKYWSGSYPYIRGYQFYADLADDAESAGHVYAARSLWLEARTAIALTTNRSGEAMALYRLATVSLMTGDTSTAEAEFLKAGELFANLPQTQSTLTYEMDSEVALASLLADRGDITSSMQKLDKIKLRLNQVTDYHIAVDFHRILAKLHLQMGDYPRAESAFWSAIRVAEWSARSLHTDGDLLAWDRETGAAYRGLVSTYNGQHRDPVETLELWEWYRALPLRLLSQRADQAGASRSQTPTSNLDFINPTNLPVEIVPLALNSSLPQLNDETVLAYDVQPDGINIWEFDDRGVQSTWVPVRSEELTTVAHRFEAECADPASDTASRRSDSEQLYRWLIKPVESRLAPGRTLVVEPDGAIGDIPLQALLDGQGRYLGSRHAMVWSPGFWHQQQLRKDKAIDISSRALVVGAPTVPSQIAVSLPSLPDAADEAADVASRFAAATLLIGPRATLKALESQLEQAEIFHFAGHALSGYKRGGLLLAKSETPGTTDGFSAIPLFNASRLQPQLLRRCQLAVLSACRTATGEKPAMTDADGLVRALMHAKVPHVVATRWNLDSEVSKVFMDVFYSDLLSGHSVSKAVQVASQEVMSKPQTSHPYYWAAFSAFGRK